jgi:release factor glutamine methyltransferase
MRHGVLHRVQLAAMDLFQGLFETKATFHLILCNPPYIGEPELATLAPEVKDHEPKGALYGGGSQGLEIIRRILARASSFLEPGGTLLMEIGHDQATILSGELQGAPWIQTYSFIKDYSGIARVLHVQKADR